MSREVAAEKIASGDFHLLRVLWCDNANIIRAKSVFLPPLLSLDDCSDSTLAQIETAITISQAQMSLPVMQDVPTMTAHLPPLKDIRLVPDWNTFAANPDTPGVATVMGNMFDGDAPWACCPRGYLQRMDEAAAEAGFEIETGIEIEFSLLKQAEDPQEFPQPIDRAPYASTVASLSSASMINNILKSIWEQGISVEQYYPESGPGQQEITLAHCSPLKMADRVILARETIHNVAASHGCIATFIPMPFAEASGNGMHIHFSLWNEGQSMMADAKRNWGLSQLAESFTAGVLSHLPALMATTTPSVNSYHRIRPHAWSGAYQAWGVQNKEAAIRLLVDVINGEPSHAEFKTVDPSANPYIALASMVAAGLDGVSGERSLPKPVTVDPGDFSEQQRRAHNIAALPTRLNESLTRLENDTVLRTAMGEPLATAFLAVRQTELEFFDGMSFDEERRLLLDRY